MNGLEEDTRLLKALAKWSGLTPAAIAKRAEVAVSTINRPFSGAATTRLGRSTIEKLRAAFPQFPGFLASEISEQVDVSLSQSDIVELDEIDLRYGLGGTYIDGPFSTEKRQFSRAWLRHVTMTSPEHLFWATGDGDSMEPTIRTGEIVLIDKSQISPRSGDGIWAIAWGDIGMIKRLRPHPDGSVEILSDNRLVPPATAVDGELHVIGRVIAVVRRL